MDTQKTILARQKMDFMSGADIAKMAVAIGYSSNTLYRWRRGPATPRFEEASTKILAWKKPEPKKKGKK